MQTAVTREEVVRIFREDRLIAVVRSAKPDLADRMARAAAEAGLRLIEITFTVPDAAALIERLSADLGSRCVIGAGTILDGKHARAALRAGAQFLVSPVLLSEMVAIAREHHVVSMPGTMTPTEMVHAANLGADFIKIYPLATIGGAAYVTQVRRTLGHLPLVATGNLTLEEIPAYLGAGVVGFGIGDPLVRPDLVERGDVNAVTENARRFLAATRAA